MEKQTTVYLIRHSEKIDSKTFIEKYNTNDNKQLRNEKKMLTIRGEEKARKLSEQEEFKNIDIIYSSNFVRAMQTAKYFAERNNLKLNIDERFNERAQGYPDLEKYPNQYVMQYWDKDFKNLEGESQSEVNKRMTEAFWEVVKENQNKKIVIISHGTAISFLLMNWCKLIDVELNHRRFLKFKEKELINRQYYSPEVFKVILDENNNIIDISNMIFEDKL